MILERVMYIHYPFYFQKDTIEIKVLIDFNNKVNTITLAYILKLGLQVCYTNVRALEIDCSILKTFRIVFASFEIKDKLG